jgi:hypothetical protein
MTDDLTTDPRQAQWPGVEPAYDMVIPSYQWLLARFEAVSGRLQWLQVLAATIMLGGPSLGKAVRADISFGSGWLIAAIVTTAAVMLLGGVAKSYGAVILPSPAVLYRECLHLSEWEYKKTAIYWAGEHFESNTKLVNRKARAAMVMTALLFIEVVLLLVWISA